MRDLIALTVRPDIISFAGGLPATDRLPVAELHSCFDAVLTRDGARALQYGPPYTPLLDLIAAHMRSRGVACSAENVFITSGAQQAMEILARLLLDPNDVIALESITFTGIIQLAQVHEASARAVPVDEETGVDVDALEEALAREPRPRFGIVVPDFHNPLGASLPVAKRMRIAEMAATHGVPIVEDDPYSMSRFEGPAAAPIKAYDAVGAVVYVGSFSKIMAPAMRLGWIVASPEILKRFIPLREAIDLESSQLIQRVVAEFMSRGHLEPYLAQLREANRERRNTMLAALDRHLRGMATWTVPQGGLFLWLRLPESIDTMKMFEAALARQTAYIPGSAFALVGGQHNTMRLNFSNCSPERISEGVGRLAQVIKEQLDARTTGTPQARRVDDAPQSNGVFSTPAGCSASGRADR
ncbi:MAG: PLP-dependent aminotransferase family protein [Acidobacteriota bacterium]